MSTHNTLISLNEETLELSADLATEWGWKDDVTFEMKLRDDVTFHDGSKFTADDVVYTFNRMIAEKASNVSTLASVEAVDEYTVRMTMNSPNMDWEMILSDTQSSILSEEACEADPEEGFAIGSGAWKVEDWTQGDYVDGDEQSFTLEKNMLRNTAVAISHKVYLEKFFAIIGNKMNA